MVLFFIPSSSEKSCLCVRETTSASMLGRSGTLQRVQCSSFNSSVCVCVCVCVACARVYVYVDNGLLYLSGLELATYVVE